MADTLARFSTGLALWSTRKKSLAALACGAVTGLGQAPFSLLWLALTGLIAAFVLFRASGSVKQAVLVGWAFGAGYFGLVLSWIVEPFLVNISAHGWMAPFALIGMSAGMALFWAAAFGLAKWQGRVLALAIFLSIAELARTYILTGFPWGLLGYIWLDWGLDQLAAYIGPHGLTLLTLLSIWALFVTVERLGLRRFIIVTGVISLVTALVLTILGYYFVSKFYQTGPNLGNVKIVKSTEAQVVRLIQPNAPQHQKWDPEMMPVFFGRSLGFTSAKSDQQPDLIIWPETSVPYLLNRSDAALEKISQAAGDVPVVFGIQRTDGLQYFNSLVLLDADGVVQDIYNKSHLVPFGEYFPGGRLATWLGLTGFAAQDGFGFGAGDGLRSIDLGALGQALPLICYEAIFPHEVGTTTERPDWLLQITNDAWFGNWTGPQQHLAQARFRAIELGLPMVRAANTGISAVIDAHGTVQASLGLGVAGFLDVELPTALPETLYSRYGDWPVIVLLIFALALIMLKTRILRD
ncbi:MAG TPA: apolipoprotein N-acyltransferase [Rhodobacteraceae bacterium]|nr:apolipoprotein N-acyltransferase [Paracoccaceae bacterium]